MLDMQGAVSSREGMQNLLSTQKAGTSLVTSVLSLWPETFPATGIFFQTLVVNFSQSIYRAHLYGLYEEFQCSPSRSVLASLFLKTYGSFSVEA